MTDQDKIDLSIFMSDYLNDARESFQEINTALLAFEKDTSRIEELDAIFRAVHTLKSSSTMLEFSDIAELAHIAEDLIDGMRRHDIQVNQENIDLLFEAIDMLESMVGARGEGKESDSEYQVVAGKIGNVTGTGAEMGEQGAARTKTSAVPTIEKYHTIRVRMELLDTLFDLVGELMILKHRIDNITSDIRDKELRTALKSMEHMIAEMHESVSTARLVPVDEIFQKFPRMVRDLARAQNKEIEFVMDGRDIELDKSMLDALGEPLIHLLRNAVDHGIEPADVRERQNKTGYGTIKLTAGRTEKHILIDVEDDGCGIDADYMRDAFARKGLITPDEAESMNENDVLNLLFGTGFSTSKEVSGVSGRGIGLSIVKTATEKMGGSVEVSTEKERGSRFNLKLPVSTAIMQTLMISAARNIFAIPTDIVLETIEVEPGDIRGIGMDEVMVLHNEVIPYRRLNELLNLPHEEQGAESIALIIRNENVLYGVGVDGVLDQMENIIKTFDPIAQQFKGFSGGTILGDGRVALLLDIPALLNQKIKGGKGDV